MRATVRKVFKSEKLGNIAGCFVEKGTLERGMAVDVCRDGEVVGSGPVIDLRRFKDNVESISEKFECGLKVDGVELLEGDELEG